ncbi:MAG: M56 family metallopeptidase [Eubacteriales bacterium]|nr:M56 family metallopeptidase [Eubacteriales bacterium]
MNLLQMSFSGAVLISAVVFIRAVAVNKLPKKTFLVLWGIVLLRLLLPFSIPSVLSIYSFAGRNVPVPMYTPAPAVGNTVSPIPYSIQQTDMVHQTQPLSENNISPVFVLLVVWCAGMILCTAFFIISYLRCRLEFRTALPVSNDFTEQWLKSHQIKRTISIRQSDRISAPLTYGIVHPVILMPKGTDWTETEQLQYVLLHEYVHIRHYDSVVKWISAFALCVHWFNPFVWAMYILFNRDIELACDESVIRCFGENSKTAYACMLINMEVKKSGLTPFCNNFSKNAIEERITAIMKIKKNTLSIVLIAAGLIVCVTTAFATSPIKSQEEREVFSDENEREVTPTENEKEVLSDGDFTDEEYEKLLALQFDGYEDMTVTHFRNKVWELTDTTEYRELLERFFQNEKLYGMRDDNETAFFIFYILEPLTAERWQTRGFGSYIQTFYPETSDNATLEYYITLTIENSDKLTVWEYKEARIDISNKLGISLSNRSEEELQDEDFMKESIDTRIDELKKQWDSDKLQITVEYYYTPLSVPEVTSENNNEEIQNTEEVPLYGNATEEDYRSLLSLKTPDYQNMSLEDFNMALLDWGNEDYDRMERINSDTGVNDYSVPLSEEEKTFAALTVRTSGIENAEFVKSHYTGKPEQDPVLGGITLQKEKAEAGLAAWCSMYYQYSYHISDKETVTVGQRDRAVGGMETAIKEFWDGTDIEDMLKMTKTDIVTKLNEFAAEYSDDHIQITIRDEYVGFESMDERDKA